MLRNKLLLFFIIYFIIIIIIIIIIVIIVIIKSQAPVVRTMDSAIHRITSQWISHSETNPGTNPGGRGYLG